jgi:hypothetical protein
MPAPWHPGCSSPDHTEDDEDSKNCRGSAPVPRTFHRGSRANQTGVGEALEPVRLESGQGGSSRPSQKPRLQTTISGLPLRRPRAPRRRRSWLPASRWRRWSRRGSRRRRPCRAPGVAHLPRDGCDSDQRRAPIVVRQHVPRREARPLFIVSWYNFCVRMVTTPSSWATTTARLRTHAERHRGELEPSGVVLTGRARWCSARGGRWATPRYFRDGTTKLRRK